MRIAGLHHLNRRELADKLTSLETSYTQLCVANDELRTALAERDAKIRELDAWLATTELQGENDSSKFDVLEKPLTKGVLVGLQASNREARKKLRELGLITESDAEK